ncbi:cadherin-like domain-containing protein [Pseudoalteromonas luteoviolacea]|uniref:cadherin-like domain-containing protein n=1 Tax=Pseudoalteromonas luteoviolacea TaxID=43657 RepID=UPI00114EC1CB|nr:cadherin-like domain-containing protein [Pseudoalteromonas luteoviolacea]TQF72514.1 tandem-95 repeat protein [Pseudoalteromonas luteoviolacea]
MKLKFLSVTIAALLATGCGSSGSDSNSAPTFSSQSYEVSLQEDSTQSLTVSATDKEQQSLTYALSNAPAHGIVEVNAQSGAIKYTPEANYHGVDSFKVSVSDGQSTAQTTINVTVSPVNDLPVIEQDKLQVLGGETKVGQLNATDIDGDSLTYSVKTAPQNGALFVDAQTGAVTYTPEKLSVATDSVVVVVTDAQGGSVEKNLEITLGLTSNTDRAYYYFASDDSNLSKAEVQAKNLSSDLNKGNVYSNIAQGYATAGLENEVTKLLSEDIITQPQDLAWAKLYVANAYIEQGKLDHANTLRQSANQLYTEYMASKGITNFYSEDQSFYSELANSYLRSEQQELADQAYNILDIAFSSVIAGNSTAAMRTYFSFSDHAGELVKTWQSSLSNTDKQAANAQLERLYRYALQMPISHARNDLNGNEGKPYHSILQVALGYVIDHYTNLNEFDKAKPILAKMLSLYGIVGYDEHHVLDIDQYADVTMDEYPFGLIDAIPRFVLLYPEKDVNLLLGKFETTDWKYGWAKDQADGAVLLAKVRNGEDKLAVLAELLKNEEGRDKRALFVDLISYNINTPGAAIYIKEQGLYPEAAAYLKAGLDILSSDEYLQANKHIVSFTTGATGCETIIDQYLSIAELTADQQYKTAAQTAFIACHKIASGLYATDTSIELDERIAAKINLLPYYGEFELAEEQAEILKLLDAEIAQTQDDEASKYMLRVARALAAGKQLTTSLSYFEQAVALIKKFDTTLDASVRFTLTYDAFDYLQANGSEIGYLGELERLAGKHADYPAAIQKARSVWTDLINSHIDDLEEVLEQQRIIALTNLSSQLLRLAQPERAIELAGHTLLGEVERDSILTAVALYYASEDAFTHSSIAHVDTDGDGLVNFFAEHATEAMIVASGLVLDTDSDNDGVEDSQDTYPLDSKRQ